MKTVSCYPWYIRWFVRFSEGDPAVRAPDYSYVKITHIPSGVILDISAEDVQTLQQALKDSQK